MRNGIDNIAGDYPEITFISFADSLLLKSQWVSGSFKSGVKYNYDPEIFFHKILPAIRDAYKTILNLQIYAIFTQGYNVYGADAKIHISYSSNHICLNSLEVPFAQLLEIDHTINKAIKKICMNLRKFIWILHFIVF